MRLCYIGQLFLLALVQSAGVTDVEAATPEADLRSLWVAYTSLRTVHLVASSEILAPGDPKYNCKGTYEYWADGDKFKMDVRWDPFIRPESSYQYYWDTKTYVAYMLGSSEIEVGTKVSTPFAVDWPPILTPFVMLRPTSLHEGWQFTLAEMRNPEFIKPLANLRGLKEGSNEVVFPAGRYDYSHIKQAEFNVFDSVYRVSFGGPSSNLPVRIRRVTQLGNYSPAVLKVIRENDTWESWDIEYADAVVDNGHVWLPRRVKHTSVAPFDDNVGDRVGIFTFTISQMAINQPIAPETFTKDLRTARNIIDLDRPAAARAPSIGK